MALESLVEDTKKRQNKKASAFGRDLEERDGSDNESGSDMDDFIEYDPHADRHYNEVSDDDEDFDGKRDLKKTRKSGLKSRAQDTMHSFKNFQGLGGANKIEAYKPLKKENKENTAQQKVNIDSLWDNYDNGNLAKQSEPEYLMKTAEEKARLEYQSIQVVKSKVTIESNSESAQNLKKRKRDLFEESEQKAKESEKVDIGDLYKAKNTADELFNHEFPSNIEANNIQLPGFINYTHNLDFPREVDPSNMEMKTDSMLIEELLEVDRKNGGEPTNRENKVDQSWASFSKTRENDMIPETFSQTPSKTAFDQNLPLENGELNFYYIDVYEDIKEHPGSVILFGKVQRGRNYESCCIFVKKIEREVYVVPSEYKRGLTQTEEEDEEAENVDFFAIMQDFQAKIPFSHQKKLKFKVVERNYNFELPILHGKRKYLKVKYDGNLAPLPQNLQSKTFSHVIGTSWSLMENFIVKKNLMGPQWIKIKEFSKVGPADKKSWCNHEIIVDYKSIEKIERDMAPSNPPLKIMTLALKTVRINDNWELAGISGITYNRVDTEKNVEVNSVELERAMFSIIRKLPGTNFPKDFDARSRNYKDIKIKAEESEVALINSFIGQIGAFDPDVLTVHDAYTSVLDTMLNRIKKLKISNWSKLSRLKKSSPIDGTGLFRARHATSGRLICDTFLSSREFIRETNYSLSHLARNFLGQTRNDFDENAIHHFYRNSDYLLQMIDHTTQDAYITSAIMFKLQIIPLTKHLTCIAGNTWIKSLQNARAERNEMLLIHEFRQRKYIYPDKFFSKNEEKLVFDEEPEAGAKPKAGAKKEKNKYAGGLVLEPKAGLYNNLILLLDFNSLYPSIIQEYDICFTTLQIPPKSLVEANKNQNQNARNQNGIEVEGEQQVAVVETDELSMIKRVDGAASVLPGVIKGLVNQRRYVKNLLKDEKNEGKREILDIKQKAIKLIANSMYGCLGFSSSRFYAKPIAATITKYGRQILEDSARKVEEKTGMRVIYGDTDSLMIDTLTNEMAKAIEMGHKIKKEINEKYKCLEIDIDGVFAPLLLLKKKKYAAMKLNNLSDFLRPGRDVMPIFKQEVKGLDMVRRDWSLISKKASSAVLKEILSGKSIDDVVDGIKSQMTSLGRRVRGEDEQSCTLDEFIITKQLTKDPHKYPNDKGQPHVQVAKRMLEKGDKNANLTHHYIPYVITKSEKEGLGDKAVHPDEFKESNGVYQIDIEWYLTQQIMPPVQRLLEVIPGIIISEIAMCLGLDGTKYKNNRKNYDDNETDDYVTKIINNFEGASGEKIEFNVRCTKCAQVQKITQKPKGSEEQLTILVCPDSQCRGIMNQIQLFNLVKLKVKEEISNYYKHALNCAECQTKNHKKFSVEELRCVQGHSLHEKKSRDILVWLRSLRSMFTLSNSDNANKVAKSVQNLRQEEMVSSTQIAFLGKVVDYINNVINLSKAELINYGSIFSKLQELNIK